MKSMNVYDVSFPSLRGSVVADPFPLLDRFFSDDPFYGRETRSPSVDVREETDFWLIEAELPGLEEKDIKLELKDNVLTLSTVKEEKKEEAPVGKWILRERRAFSFSRSFVIPEDADNESVKATFRDGLLSVRVSKKPETAPRVVQVNVN